MKTVKVCTVGRLKEPHWQAAAAHYQKRLAYSLRLQWEAIKDAAPKLLPEAKAKDESERLATLVKPTDVLICLDDKGRTHSSESFATFLGSLYDYGATPCFAIGGAYGLAEPIKKSARHTISLSAMTFTHEMALVILLEQLYRAETILLGTGYHHK